MRKLSRIVTVCVVSIVLLASCSANIGDGNQSQAPLKQLSCIAVLPAGTAVDKDEVYAEQVRSLEKGAAYATGIMVRELSGNTKARLISVNQAGSFAPEVSGGLFGMVSAVGKKVGCEGVLVTTVRRFKQREGTEYASDDPASADFQMTLIHASSGAVLWSADFRETQESFLENILTFDKVQHRGLKWISVEQLMEQGLIDRLATCPYLK